MIHPVKWLLRIPLYPFYLLVARYMTRDGFYSWKRVTAPDGNEFWYVKVNTFWNDFKFYFSLWTDKIWCIG